MKPNQHYQFDRDYLKRCKSSTPEQKLDWLAAAAEFVQECSKKHKTANSRSQ